MSITLILGPVRSGKTRRLVRHYECCARDGLVCSVVKHIDDTRARDTLGDAGLVATHDGKAIHSTAVVGRLADAREQTDRARCVFVDEGRFFEDIADEADRLAARGKLVFVSFLNGNHRREPFGDLGRIVAKADRVCVTRHACVRCRRVVSAFSAKTSGNRSVIFDVGGADKYANVCRACHSGIQASDVASDIQASDVASDIQASDAVLGE